MRRVVTWQLTGEQPRDLRLTWGIDHTARAALEDELFGKHVLITSHDDWPVAEVIAGRAHRRPAEATRHLRTDHAGTPELGHTPRRPTTRRLTSARPVDIASVTIWDSST